MRRAPVVFVCVIAGLVALRLCLPFLVRSYLNRKLSRLDGYRGRVDGVALSIWRAAYRIDGLTLRKIDGDASIPFFSCKRIDLSLETLISSLR